MLIAESVITKNSSFIQKYLATFKWDKILNDFTSAAFSVIVISIFFIIISRVGKFFINKAFKQYAKSNNTNNSAKRINTLHVVSNNSFQYGLVFFWIYSVLSEVGVPIGTLLASASIFSVAIGIGAQGLVTDIVTGFLILFEKQIDVGEYVTITMTTGTQIEGTVTGVALRTTELTSFTGYVNYIPNRQLAAITNRNRSETRAIIQIRINGNTPVDKTIGVINKVNAENVKKYPDIIAAPDVWGAFNTPDGNLAIQVNIETKNGQQLYIQHQFLGLYLDAISDAGIELPKSPVVLN
ncbi:mechanosensitive ion channel family protein [Nicoliella spurrieriana]|uniref:Mechanosensitive ion channel family protein n=1 Tax=Nicoliella spurrieriana TaxID=2925830 RepID=A0A976RS25_9LACO|nr:mechanosensitive ion channel family protein [Nicoliella spurrieriana]UQS86779.1 mechanosensitive ion channel family protein [Nicoliella spurrieriana]